MTPTAGEVITLNGWLGSATVGYVRELCMAVTGGSWATSPPCYIMRAQAVAVVYWPTIAAVWALIFFFSAMSLVIINLKKRLKASTYACTTSCAEMLFTAAC